MKPAQQELVERFVSWDRIRDRLDRYPAISQAFPLGLLERYGETPPYFCHYMGWRLGVWSETLFPRLEELLSHAERLPGWDGEQTMLDTPDFAAFWPLVWQLQVGEYLSTVGADVRCGNPGPDYAVTINGTTVYVECYCYRKSFGIADFLQEVLWMLDGDLRLDHNYFAPFSLPANDRTSEFLDRALRPFLNEGQLAAWREQRAVAWPVKISEPASTLVIYLNGDDFDVYDADAADRDTHEPQAYIEVIVREALVQKANSNQLGRHRPNVVAVNYVLSAEAQLAFHLRDLNFCPLLGPNLDGLAISVAGIDQRLTREDLALLPSGPTRDPALDVIARPLEVRPPAASDADSVSSL